MTNTLSLRDEVYHALGFHWQTTIEITNYMHVERERITPNIERVAIAQVYLVLESLVREQYAEKTQDYRSKQEPTVPQNAYRLPPPSDLPGGGDLKEKAPRPLEILVA